MLCVNGKVDESGQIRLLTFRENSSRRIRELRSGSPQKLQFLILNNQRRWFCLIWSYRTSVMGHQLRPGHDRPCRAVGLIRWRVILSVLGEELGSPPFKGLAALCHSFPKRPTSLQTESQSSRYSQTSEQRSEYNLYWQI